MRTNTHFLVVRSMGSRSVVPLTADETDSLKVLKGAIEEGKPLYIIAIQHSCDLSNTQSGLHERRWYH